MTLLMRDKENFKLGKTVNLVNQIRGLGDDQIATASYFLKVEPTFIHTVLELIEKYPDWDDEDIASALENESILK